MTSGGLGALVGGPPFCPHHRTQVPLAGRPHPGPTHSQVRPLSGPRGQHLLSACRVPTRCRGQTASGNRSHLGSFSKMCTTSGPLPPEFRGLRVEPGLVCVSAGDRPTVAPGLPAQVTPTSCACPSLEQGQDHLPHLAMAQGLAGCAAQSRGAAATPCSRVPSGRSPV